ncbi:MAG: PAS domain S-box protein [Bacteroidia bacterium]
MKNNSPHNTFFKTFLHQCNDLVVITNKYAGIVYVNPAFEKHTGYKSKEITGKNISVIKSGCHTISFYRSLWKKLQAGRAHSCVFINKKKSGDLYYEHKTITPIRNKKDEIEYYLSTSKDVTGELKLQKEVIKQKNFIHTVVQNTNALIIGIDLNFDITLFNTTCEKLTGYTFQEVKGKSIFSLLIPGNAKKLVLSSLNDLKEQRKSLRNEYALVTKSGMNVLVSWSHTVIKDENGLPQTLLSTGIDVTKERSHEKKLLQLNSSLDQKVKAKTKKLSDLNGKILTQNKFVKKINSELPALVYLVDFETNTIKLFNNKINKKISLPEKKNKDILISQFLKYIDTSNGIDYCKMFLEAPVDNIEIPFIINEQNYWFQNRSIIFEKSKRGKVVKILGFISDITKTKYIQNKLEESQKIAKVGTWEWNIEKDNLYWSDQIYRIFEIDPAVFKPSYTKFLRAIHPEDKGSVVEAVNRSLVNKSPYEIIHRLKAINNKIKFVREKGYTEFSAKGLPVRMIGTIQDVTEEKLLKEKLRSAYVTLQNSLNAIITTDLNGVVTFANNAAIKMWGYYDYQDMVSEGSLLNRYWSPRHKNKIKSIKEQVLIDGYYFSEYPFSSIKNDGTEILVKFNLSLIRGGDKKPKALTWCFFDITEQIRIEEKVKEYDKKINLLLGNIDEVVFGIDPQYGSHMGGEPFFVSAKSSELMGFTFEDLKTNQNLWQSLIHPDDLEQYCMSYLECISGRTSKTRTYRMKHRETNVYKWFEEKITPYYDETGELKSYYGSARDVTERILKDKKLKESEEKYRLLSENNHDFISLRDSKGNALFVSNAVQELLGYTVEEYLTTNLFEMLHPEDRERIKMSTFDPNFQNRLKGFTEGRIRHKNGHYVWVQTVTKPVMDDIGNVIGVVGSSRDITERKKLEDTIKESEKKYRSIFENALAGIFRANLKTRKPIDANDVCVEMYGYDSKEDFLENFNAPERYYNLLEREEWLKNLGENPLVVNQNIRFRRKDGSLFWGYVSAKIIEGEDIMEGVVIDVTKNHEYEEKLKKNLTEKELLLKEVHHRVKNNLQIISSLLKLQLNKFDDPKLREPLIECCERIHAIALIHEKLYLSEDISTINFSDYLTNLTKSMFSLHGDKKIHLKFNVTPFLTNISVAIPLGLICYEIISNSFKHAFRKKENYDLCISVNPCQGGNQIVINDSGDGFDTEILKSTNTLGWKLICNLARQAKATLEVNSVREEGTMFKIVLN